MANKPEEITGLYKKAIRLLLTPGTITFQFDRKFRFANPLVKKGTPLVVAPEMLLGKRIETILPAYLTTNLRAAVDKVIATKMPQNFECPFKWKHADRTLSVHLIPVLNPETALVEYIATIMDVTELKKSEKEIIRFSRAVERSGEIIFLTDCEGMITYINPKFIEVYGYKSDEVVSKTTPRILKSGIMKRKDYTLFWKTILNKQVMKGELVNKTKDGRMLNVEGSANPILDKKGNIIGFLGIQRDITERKKTETALKESEEEYRTLFNSSADAIMTLEPPNWRFTSGNPATVKMFKAKNEKDFTSRGPWKLSPPKQPDGTPSMVKAKRMIGIAMKRGSHFFEWTHRRADGEEFPATVLLTRTEIEGKKLLQATVRDITEQRKAEETIKNYSLKLEALSEVKDEFIRNITHELKTPLSVILSNISLLRDIAPIGREKEWTKLLDMLNRNSERLRSSIDQILQLSRLEATELKKERIYIKDLAEDIYKEHLPLAKMKGVELKMEIEPIVMVGDGALLKLAINNLVSNAVKFTEYGSVTIAARVIDGRVVVSVADTGIGMSPENQKRLFEKFFKADPSAPGTGIGLTIIKQIVEKHGGSINVKSALGKGSTFEIVLPHEPGRKTKKADKK